MITVAFDCDGTLIDYEGNMNTPLVALATALAQLRGEVEVIVWSGGGQGYAEGVAQRCGLPSHVKAYMKHRDLHPDIAIDDMPDASWTAALTLIVGKKG